jgi:hypothetical protein
MPTTAVTPWARARRTPSRAVVEDQVDHRLVKRPVVAVGEEVELERLALHAAFVRDVGDGQVAEIRLARQRAQRGELGAVEGDLVIAPRMPVGKRLQLRLGGRGRVALFVLVQQGQAGNGTFFGHPPDMKPSGGNARGFRIRDSRFRMGRVGEGIADSGFKIPNLES